MLSGILKALWEYVYGKSVVPPSTEDDAWRYDCEPWSSPNHMIRLQKIGSKLRIYGFPSELPWDVPLHDSFAETGPPVMFLCNPFPAYANYIMGSGWQQRLESVEGEEGQVILRDLTTCNDPAVDQGQDKATIQQDEDKHCLRMRRCGAIVVYSTVSITMREQMPYCEPLQPSEKQYFGWPKDGGVCILRSPFVAWRYLPLERQLEWLRHNSFEEFERIEQVWAGIELRLKDAETMEAVCDILTSEGGQYYENLSDCPEAHTLRL
jgi:hypothetical protein